MSEHAHQVSERIGPGSVSVTRTGGRTYEGLNERGATVRIGGSELEGEHFTPGELLKIALIGCAGTQHRPGRRAPPRRRLRDHHLGARRSATPNRTATRASRRSCSSTSAGSSPATARSSSTSWSGRSNADAPWPAASKTASNSTRRSTARPSEPSRRPSVAPQSTARLRLLRRRLDCSVGQRRSVRRGRRRRSPRWWPRARRGAPRTAPVYRACHAGTGPRSTASRGPQRRARQHEQHHEPRRTRHARDVRREHEDRPVPEVERVRDVADPLHRPAGRRRGPVDHAARPACPPR